MVWGRFSLVRNKHWTSIARRNSRSTSSRSSYHRSGSYQWKSKCFLEDIYEDRIYPIFIKIGDWNFFGGVGRMFPCFFTNLWIFSQYLKFLWIFVFFGDFWVFDDFSAIRAFSTTFRAFRRFVRFSFFRDFRLFQFLTILSIFENLFNFSRFSRYFVNLSVFLRFKIRQFRKITN